MRDAEYKARDREEARQLATIEDEGPQETAASACLHSNSNEAGQQQPLQQHHLIIISLTWDATSRSRLAPQTPSLSLITDHKRCPSSVSPSLFVSSPFDDEIVSMRADACHIHHSPSRDTHDEEVPEASSQAFMCRSLSDAETESESGMRVCGQR